MKMTLDQLRVDSYATQVNESELTEVKGGTTPLCVVIVVAAGLLTSSCAATKPIVEECTPTDGPDDAAHDENGVKCTCPNANKN